MSKTEWMYLGGAVVAFALCALMVAARQWYNASGLVTVGGALVFVAFAGRRDRKRDAKGS